MGMINIQPKTLEGVVVMQLEKFKKKYQPWSAEIYELTKEVVGEIAQDVVLVASNLKEKDDSDTQPYFDKEFNSETEVKEAKSRSVVMTEKDIFLEKHMAKAVELGDEEL